jgi:hypothetical protein
MRTPVPLFSAGTMLAEKSSGSWIVNSGLKNKWDTLSFKKCFPGIASPMWGQGVSFWVVFHLLFS